MVDIQRNMYRWKNIFDGVLDPAAAIHDQLFREGDSQRGVALLQLEEKGPDFGMRL